MNARQVISVIVLVAVTVATSTRTASPGGRGPRAANSHTNRDRLSVLKQEIVLIPAGSILEVRLQDKRKVAGRLGAISDESFELQFVKGDQVVKESIPFDNVKSYRKIHRDGMSTRAKIGLGMLAGIGALCVVGSSSPPRGAATDHHCSWSLEPPLKAEPPLSSRAGRCEIFGISRVDPASRQALAMAILSAAR